MDVVAAPIAELTKANKVAVLVPLFEVKGLWAVLAAAVVPIAIG